MAKVEAKFLTKLVPEDVGGVARQVSFILGNGLKVVQNLDNLSAEMIERLAVHGLSQKIGDAASGFSKARDFSAAFGAMQGVSDNLEKGLWSSRAGSSQQDLVTALATLQGCSAEDAQAAVDKATDEQLEALRKNAEVKAEIAKIQAARLAEIAKGTEAASLKDLMAEILPKT